MIESRISLNVHSLRTLRLRRRKRTIGPRTSRAGLACLPSHSRGNDGLRFSLVGCLDKSLEDGPHVSAVLRGCTPQLTCIKAARTSVLHCWTEGEYLERSPAAIYVKCMLSGGRKGTVM